jgi:hypothetical protein
MNEAVKRMYDDTVGFKYLHPVTPIQQVQNLVREAPAIIKSGFKQVPDDVYEQRMSICRTCYFWHEGGNLGLGKCEHPKCGCSKGKMKLSVSECPVGNWGSYNG